MLPGVPSLPASVSFALYEVVVLVLGTVAIGGIFGAALRAPEPQVKEGDINVEDLPDGTDIEGYVALKEPDISGSRFGFVGVLWSLYQHHIRRRRLARKGYVQWFRVDNGVLTGPHYVRPERSHDTNVPEVDYDGGTYQFPDAAMVPDRRSGMWTVIHRTGQSDPLNLRDSDETAISAEQAKEWANLKVTSAPPGWMGRLDLDAKTIFYSALGLTILIAVLGGQF